MLAICAPLDQEDVPIDEADGRVLADTLCATRDHPPFDASAMDGWAVRQADLTDVPSVLSVIGESLAGRRFERSIVARQAIRIFTGAPLPIGADRVVIQERTTLDGDRVTLTGWADDPRYVRPRGGDFRRSESLVKAGTRLHPGSIALLAAAGHAIVPVTRRPRIAVLATGDELVRPAQTPGDDQIHDSVGPALVGLVRRWGGVATRLSIAGDRSEAIIAAVAEAECDLLVTIGGASIGDHDLVKPALTDLGLRCVVEGVAMKPGKPVWFGRLSDGRRVLGLPGNPASALVCAEVFLAGVLAALGGGVSCPIWHSVRLAAGLPANGPREHLMRARIVSVDDGVPSVVGFDDQDSGWVSVMARADILLRRPAHDPARIQGDRLEALRLTGHEISSPW